MPVTELSEKTILCIGDEIGDEFAGLNLRRSVLRDHGWNVIRSSKAHEGVTRFGQERVDAVVFDLNKDGSESAVIAAVLKRQGPELPIVIVVRDEAALARRASAQADAVVLKSEEGSKLNETLRRLFRVQ